MTHKQRQFLKTQIRHFPWFKFPINQPILLNETDAIVGAFTRLCVVYWRECGDLVMDAGIEAIGEPALFRLREIRAIEIVRGKRRKIKIKPLDDELEHALKRAEKYADKLTKSQFKIETEKTKVNATTPVNSTQNGGVDLDDPKTRRKFIDVAKRQFHVTAPSMSAFNNHVEIKFSELKSRAVSSKIDHPLAYYLRSIEQMGWTAKRNHQNQQ